MTKISTVISYCSTEKRFIDRCIKSVESFSNEIVIVSGDHLFDGTPEDMGVILENKRNNPNGRFILFNWTPGKPSRYWHNYGRFIGANLVKDNCDWVLFLDADEIVDTSQFEKLIDNISDSYYSYRLSNYWYFREENYRAHQLESGPVLVQSKYSTKFDLDSNYEREQLINADSLTGVMYNNRPICHHYSWVRTKEEMLKKVSSWGHNNDTDWTKLVEEEFNRPFNGKCFVHPDYTFDIVE